METPRCFLFKDVTIFYVSGEINGCISIQYVYNVFVGLPEFMMQVLQANRHRPRTFNPAIKAQQLNNYLPQPRGFPRGFWRGNDLSGKGGVQRDQRFFPYISFE
jgi:hypothetical protein